MGYDYYFYLTTWERQKGIFTLSPEKYQTEHAEDGSLIVPTASWNPRGALVELLKEALWKGQIPDFENNEAFLAKCEQGSVAITENKFLLYVNSNEARRIVKDIFEKYPHKKIVVVVNGHGVYVNESISPEGADMSIKIPVHNCPHKYEKRLRPDMEVAPDFTSPSCVFIITSAKPPSYADHRNISFEGASCEFYQGNGVSSNMRVSTN